MRCILGLLVLVLSASASAVEGPRVQIEETGDSVAHPAGWTLAPVSGLPPVVVFNLCDPAMPDGCLVLGEMSLSTPNPERKILSFEDLPKAATGRLQEGLPPPRRMRSGRHEAIETFVRGPHSSHITKEVTRGYMQIQTPAGVYACMLTFAPDLFDTRLQQWRDFCASLELANHTPD